MLKRSLLTKHHNTTEGESDEGEQSTTNEGNSDINGDVTAQHDGSRLTAEENSHYSAISDTVKVASGHLIRLKCKAGVTQSLLPSIVEMNEAVVDRV